MAKTPGFKITRSIPELLAKQSKPAILPETGWWKIGASEAQLIPFQQGWGNVVNASLDFAPLRYYLSEDGEVRLHGHITGGSPGSKICTLPAEARPEFDETFICPLSDGSGHATIRIRTNGDVELVNIV